MHDNRDYIATRRALQHYDHLRETRDLMDRMALRATKDRSYAAAFLDWLENGATLKLRELASPFGDFWGNLHNFNILTAIDSAHLHRKDPIPAA